MTARYRVVIVDDEEPARKKIARRLEVDPRFVRVAEAGDAEAAVRCIAEHRPALVFVDVGLGGRDGLALVAGLAARPLIVFSTAYSEHAVRAFELDAVDYLLKPYDGARLRRALDKAHAQLTARDAEPATLAVQRDGGTSYVPLDAITRIAVYGKYVHVHTDTAMLAVREPLAALLERLPPGRFVRVHRSEVVQVRAIVRIEPRDHGDAIAVLRDGSSVVVSRGYRGALHDCLARPR